MASGIRRCAPTEPSRCASASSSPSARRLEATEGDAVPSLHDRSDRLRARLSQLMYADEQPLPEEEQTTKSLPEGGTR